MQVVFRTNLGRIDANKFGIDGETFKQCRKGAKVNVSADVAQALAHRKIVEPLKSRDIEGVSPATELRGVGSKADK